MRHKELGGNFDENKTHLENAGYIFDGNITDSTISAKMRTMSQIAQNGQIKKVDFRVPLNTHIHGREFHHQLGRISSDVSLTYENVNSIIRRLFCAKNYSGQISRPDWKMIEEEIK